MFFQVESAENFSKFCLKGYTLNKNYTNNIAKKNNKYYTKTIFLKHHSKIESDRHVQHLSRK